MTRRGRSGRCVKIGRRRLLWGLCRCRCRWTEKTREPWLDEKRPTATIASEPVHAASLAQRERLKERKLAKDRVQNGRSDKGRGGGVRAMLFLMVAGVGFAVVDSKRGRRSGKTITNPRRRTRLRIRPKPKEQAGDRVSSRAFGLGVSGVSGSFPRALPPLVPRPVQLEVPQGRRDAGRVTETVSTDIACFDVARRPQKRLQASERSVGGRERPQDRRGRGDQRRGATNVPRRSSDPRRSTFALDS